ncbi:hypothetical protein K505DRAFT_345774 [Melanomma pulvis-pyrius CBS 109.77]|uniref:Wax synthase domain-containing protein n=1 Tax=Melanomma pulvis-pyrius CBS 109.77 TaxID=1314802 RepID=A0A6A6XSQ2_9PLEO|nr:hypothetical protein K505DRAFT_345774 [Melanomma pulvis-pyrius CBS 109.77]
MHPVFYLVAEIAITVLVVGFVPPKSVLLPLSLVPIIFCLFQHQWTKMAMRLAFELMVTSSLRFIGTSYQVRNVPAVIATERTYYIQRTFSIIVLSYIVLDFINSSKDVDIASKYLNINKILLLSRLNEVTVEELLIRSFTSGIYYTLAVLAVSTGVSSPSGPPFYGSPCEAYTLRGFWNIFWHQTNEKKFTTISHYLVHDDFTIRRGTTIARCLRILAAFMSSGIMHMLVDLASGIEFGSSGAMKFFNTQALVLIIEDAVIRAYQRLPRVMRLSKVAENGIGFSWVSLFLAWSVPTYVYPMMWRSNQGLNDSTIPFTLFSSNAERINAVS